jgi:hypothetical protein
MQTAQVYVSSIALYGFQEFMWRGSWIHIVSSFILLLVLVIKYKLKMK